MYRFHQKVPGQTSPPEHGIRKDADAGCCTSIIIIKKNPNRTLKFITFHSWQAWLSNSSPSHCFPHSVKSSPPKSNFSLGTSPFFFFPSSDVQQKIKRGKMGRPDGQEARQGKSSGIVRTYSAKAAPSTYSICNCSLRYASAPTVRSI